MLANTVTIIDLQKRYEKKLSQLNSNDTGTALFTQSCTYILVTWEVGVSIIFFSMSPI